MAELLKAENVSEVFGGLKAVSDFNFHINPGELVGLIGPNGAGKTTAFNLFTGVYQPTTGTIMFDGKSIVGLKPYEITQRGIARTFQNIRLFSELTVLENVKIAFHFHVKYGLLESVLRVGRYFREEEQIEAESMKLLKIFHLEDKADEVAKNLPYGAQRRLEIARAGSQAKASVARRAGCRYESAGNQGTHGNDPLDPEGIRSDGPAH